MPKDYYKVLGVEKNASAEDVKNAFRRLAMQHHPDRGGEAEKFKEINEAYQVLSDPAKRGQYDRFGSVPEGGGGFPGGGFNGNGFNVNFEDLGDIFGGFGDLFGMGGRGARGEERGRDIQVDVKISFLDAVFGVAHSFDLYKAVRCEKCSGSGGEPGAKQNNCPTCRGKGKITQNKNTMFGVFQSVSVCSSCRGAGRTYEKNCSVCSGRGVMRERKSITVKIPAGIADGNTIKVTGEGEAGERGIASGDLYVTIAVKSDPRFARRGFDIASEVRVSFSDAALGAVYKVETVDGEVELKIPTGTQPGTVLRLRGKGIPHLRTGERGDHFVTVIVEVPKKLSKKQKKLLEELKEAE
jgi:molecular chaperone DnaJ